MQSHIYIQVHTYIHRCIHIYTIVSEMLLEKLKSTVWDNYDEQDITRTVVYRNRLICIKMGESISGRPIGHNI